MTIPPPKYYADSLQDLDKTYRLILQEFSTSYPNAKINPDDQNYIDALQTVENNLNETEGELFQLNNNLERDIRTLGRDSKIINKKINEVQKENKHLKKRLNGMSGSKEAAIGMFDDIQLRYNQYLLGNCIFLIAIIGVGASFYKNQKQ